MPSQPNPWPLTAALHLALLLPFTLLLRVLGASGPYYVDGPRHIRAIQSGRLIIQPPGYLVFNVLGWLLSHAAHISAAAALQALNITFSVAGVAVFYLLARRILSNPSTALWLSLAYACSPVVWFAGEIHSTYAAMTFFAPLLLLTVEAGDLFVLGCIVWALMMALRPSDGAFVLPWMIYQARRFPWRQRVFGTISEAVITGAWWLPTARRFGSGLLSPLLNSHRQAASLAQGPLAGHLTIHAAVNEVHLAWGILLAWGLLTPLLPLAIVRLARTPLVRSLSFFIAPGLTFFMLYFFSDALYLAYAIAPGMLLAALLLQQMQPARARGLLIATTAVSLLFMFAARPASHPSRSRAVLDAYLFRYSVPSLKQQKAERLAKLTGSCGDADVRGGSCR